MKLERRLVSAPVEVRTTEGQPATIAGYAAVFNTEAVIAGMFRERIAPGAFRSVIGATADVRALFNHDDNLVLARTTNGTLRLAEDARGLAYDFTPNPDDSDAMNVVAKIKRGDVSQSSYGFRVKADEWTKPTRAGELPLRTINEFELLRDVSPVTFPAFEETTAEARSAAEATRATATGMSADDAEETAEAIQYQGAKDLLDQASALIAKAMPIVNQLLADEANEPASGDDEVAEEAIEVAQFNVLGAHVSQLSSVAQSLCSLVYSLKSQHGSYGYYSSALATERARVDLVELDA